MNTLQSIIGRLLMFRLVFDQGAQFQILSVDVVKCHFMNSREWSIDYIGLNVQIEIHNISLRAFSDFLGFELSHISRFPISKMYFLIYLVRVEYHNVPYWWFSTNMYFFKQFLNFRLHSFDEMVKWFHFRSQVNMTSTGT